MPLDGVALAVTSPAKRGISVSLSILRLAGGAPARANMPDAVPEEGHKQSDTVLGGICRLLRCIGLAGALGGLPGCSVLLLSAGPTALDVPKLEAAKTRAEFEAIAGEAATSTKTAEGNQLAVYKYFGVAGPYPRGCTAKGWGAFSPIPCAPWGLVPGKVYVTYAPDGRVLWVGFHAGFPLRQSFWWQMQSGSCPRWVPCVTAFWDELRQRATALSYILTAEDEALYRGMLEIAGDTDGGRIPQEEAIRRMECLRHGVPEPSGKGRAIPVSPDQVELVDVGVHAEAPPALLAGRLRNRSALLLTDVGIKVSFYDGQGKIGEATVGGLGARLQGKASGEKGISDMRVLPGEGREFAVRLEGQVPAHYLRAEFQVFDSGSFCPF